jgi:hypothetical protein
VTTLSDQVIDADKAVAVQRDVARNADLLAWIVTANPAEHEGRLVARLVTTRATPYVLVADNLHELRWLLPQGLVHEDRQPSDPVNVIGAWFPHADR